MITQYDTILILWCLDFEENKFSENIYFLLKQIVNVIFSDRYKWLSLTGVCDNHRQVFVTLADRYPWLTLTGICDIAWQVVLIDSNRYMSLTLWRTNVYIIYTLSISEKSHSSFVAGQTIFPRQSFIFFKDWINKTWGS